MDTKRIVITGGHPSPALAVIDQILETKTKWKIFFFGVKHPLTRDKAVSYEYKEIKKRNIPFYNLSTKKSRLFIPFEIIRSLILLLKIRPDIVLSFGGYLGIPVAVAAFILRIPVVTHEQSLELGAANKLISRFANKVLLSWPQTAIFLPRSKKFTITGLPIRKALLKIKREEFDVDFERNNKPLLYITGGSQGAHFINNLVGENFDSLLKNFNIIHQVGESTRYNDLPKLKALKRKGYLPTAHISSDRVGWILKNSDIIISRAGMNTICEFLYLRKHALVIPLPKRINPEQIRNAKLYEKSGLGVVLEQEKATDGKFLKELLRLSKHIRTRKNKARPVKGQKLQSPKAAKKILCEVEAFL
jgi:UDP-N-acetylglucosamine--N-acetylmuramyl-(pentapeptide) pyrophosphoryl-undecaprenol N-acetylglucosamine transferase